MHFNTFSLSKDQIILSNLKVPDYQSQKIYVVRLSKLFPFNMSHVFSNHWKISQSDVSVTGTDSQMSVQLEAPT